MVGVGLRRTPKTWDPGTSSAVSGVPHHNRLNRPILAAPINRSTEEMTDQKPQRSTVVRYWDFGLETRLICHPSSDALIASKVAFPPTTKHSVESHGGRGRGYPMRWNSRLFWCATAESFVTKTLVLNQVTCPRTVWTTCLKPKIRYFK